MPSTVMGLSAGMFNAVGKNLGLTIVYGVGLLVFVEEVATLSFLQEVMNPAMNKRQINNNLFKEICFWR